MLLSLILIIFSRCEPGLIPKPDTITGCGPECVIDPDCPGDYVCESQKCIPRPDPCDPSPCGPGAICTVGPSGNPICRCEPGLIPNPDTITGCKPECVRDPDCPGRDYICENQKYNTYFYTLYEFNQRIISDVF